jgi:hypothetical protein
MFLPVLILLITESGVLQEEPLVYAVRRNDCIYQVTYKVMNSVEIGMLMGFLSQF